MTEYTAIMLGLGIVMFFLFELAASLGNYKEDENNIMKHFKLACILMAFLLGIAVLGLGIGVAYENSASSTIKTAIEGAFGAYTILCIVGGAFLLIYFLVLIPRWLDAATKKKKIDGDDDG